MAKLGLSVIPNDKPVEVALELQATVHRDLVDYADYRNCQHVSVAFVGGVSRG